MIWYEANKCKACLHNNGFSTHPMQGEAGLWYSFSREKCRIQDRERRIYALKYLHAVQGVLDEVQSNKSQTRHSKQRDVK